MKQARNRMVSQEQSSTREESPAVEADNAPFGEARKPPCPSCGSRVSRVNGTKGVHRSRICGGCGKAFSTIEQVKK